MSDDPGERTVAVADRFRYRRRMKRGEFFYYENGKRCDAALHEEMLVIGVDTATLERHVAHAVSIGVDEAAARAIYGLPKID